MESLNDGLEPPFTGMQLDLQKQYSLDELMEAGKGVSSGEMSDEFDSLDLDDDLDLDDLDLDDEAFVLSEEDETLLQIEAEPSDLTLPEPDSEPDDLLLPQVQELYEPAMSTIAVVNEDAEELALPGPVNEPPVQAVAESWTEAEPVSTEASVMAEAEPETSELLDLEIPDHTLEIHLTPEQPDFSLAAADEPSASPLESPAPLNSLTDTLLVEDDTFAIEEDLQHFTPAEVSYSAYPVTSGYEDERLKLNASLREQLEVTLEERVMHIDQVEDVQLINQFSQDLFLKTLQPGMHRLTKVWHSESQILDLYEQLESVSRQRGPVEQIIATAQQIAIAQEVADTQMLKPEEASQALQKVKALRDVLAVYEQLLGKLV